jgi:cation transport regulator ChaB
MKITPQMLRDKRACSKDIEIFEREWPAGVDITENVILRIYDLGLDVQWGVYKFLSSPAQKAYEKAIATAEEAYEKAIAPAQEAYEKAIAPAWEAYKKAIAPAIIRAIQLQESGETTPTA